MHALHMLMCGHTRAINMLICDMHALHMLMCGHARHTHVDVWTCTAYRHMLMCRHARPTRVHVQA